MTGKLVLAILGTQLGCSLGSSVAFHVGPLRASVASSQHSSWVPRERVSQQNQTGAAWPLQTWLWNYVTSVASFSYSTCPLHMHITGYNVAVQSLSSVWLFATPWTAACQASLSFTVSRNLFKFMSIELVMLSNHLIFCCPLLFLPSIFLRILWFNKIPIWGC